MKSFDCHFTFNTIVQTHGRNSESAVNNIEELLNEDIKSAAESIFSCGVNFNKEDISVKEIYNGWFELNLLWSGYWNIDADDELKARKIAEKILDEKLTPFYQVLENKSTKQRRFYFKELKDEKITDVMEY